MNLKMMGACLTAGNMNIPVNKNENYEGWAMINYKWFVDYKKKQFKSSCNRITMF
jgi:hypothetical protein